MAKLLPMLTAAAMIGAIGGVVLWLIVLHRESVALEAGVPAAPIAGGQAQPGGSSTSAPAGSETTGWTRKFLPAQSGGETPLPSRQTGPSRGPLAAESAFTPEASQANPVRATLLLHSGAAPVSASFAKMPLSGSGAGIDEALTFALEAAQSYEKQGFTVREDYWGGQLPIRQTKAIVHQLFKGNSYWFWMGTSIGGAKIAVHIYDSDGRLVEAESWQKPQRAAAMIVPKKTGTYYLIVEVEKSPAERSPWALAYGFR